jgi:two-component system, sensor histidine kinase
MSEWRSKRSVMAPRIDSRRHREIHDALGSAAFEQLLDRFFNEAEQLLVTLRAAETADQATRLRHVLAAAAGNVGFSRLAVMARLATPDDVPILRAEIGRLQVDRNRLIPAL